MLIALPGLRLRDGGEIRAERPPAGVRVDDAGAVAEGTTGARPAVATGAVVGVPRKNAGQLGPPVVRHVSRSLLGIPCTGASRSGPGTLKR